LAIEIRLNKLATYNVKIALLKLRVILGKEGFRLVKEYASILDDQKYGSSLP